MFHLLKIDTCAKCHQEDEYDYPPCLSVKGLSIHDPFPHIDADEEDGDAAPEYFQVPYSLIDRCHPLHHHAPYDCHHGQPTIERILLDEFHVKGSDGVEHHDGRDIPEMEFTIEPEVPIDKDVTQ